MACENCGYDGEHIWVLRLNDMRGPKVEVLTPVCQATTEQELRDLLERESVETYHDGKWGKTFRQGGPLEWYNRPWTDDYSFVEVPVDKWTVLHLAEISTIEELTEAT